MDKGIIVESMFDGGSCGNVALKRLDIKIDKYYAYEIDKYAIKVAKENHPEIIHLADVNNWEKNDIKPDLMLAGSPCQGFSFAGKQLNFDDPRSKLFFVFAEAVKKRNPKYFLLENVMMKKECHDVITDILGVEPIIINSALVSAQNRKRVYWTNIPGVEQPKDLGIKLKDIIETKEEVIGAAMRGRYDNNGKTKQFIEARRDEKANCLTTATKNSLCIEVGKTKEIKGFDIIKRVYSTEGKCHTLITTEGGNRQQKIAVDDVIWRKLTPLECERLQCLPDNYTSSVSDSQRYKIIGNGWNVDTICHILKNIK